MPPAISSVNAADLLRIRVERNRLLGRHLFLPSAWDILLYLQSVDEPSPVEDICRVLSMHLSNADRWLAVLGEERLVEFIRIEGGAPAFRLTQHARDNLTAALGAASH